MLCNYIVCKKIVVQIAYFWNKKRRKVSNEQGLGFSYNWKKDTEKIR